MRQIRFRGVNDDVSIHRSIYSIYRAPISPDDVGSAPRTAQTELQKHNGLHLQPLHPHPALTSPLSVVVCVSLVGPNNRISYINHWRLSLSQQFDNFVTSSFSLLTARRGVASVSRLERGRPALFPQ